MQWKSAFVKPRSVYHWDEDLGRERCVRHEFLIITMANGQQFVLDPTGYQFGFPGWLYKKSDYYSSFITVHADEQTRSFSSERLQNFYNAVIKRYSYDRNVRQWRKLLSGQSLEQLKACRVSEEAEYLQELMEF